MMQLADLVAYCDNVLDISRFQDYCPNGLQVQGRAQVEKLISGVTASQALLDSAVAEQADAILVHHGYFWKGEDSRIVALKQRRLRTLLCHDISLIAYHLPLDAHPELGNNAQLAKLCGFTPRGNFGGRGKEPDLGWHGELAAETSGEDLCVTLSEKLQRQALHINGSDKPIKTLAWCSGGAQSYIEQAAQLGVDAYISGEISEYTVHVAREYGLHYFAAGHHATERYGVQALGQHLQEKFSLQHQFIDIDNPV